MIFIHIGLPKTATTTLQKTIFNNHTELNYYNRATRASELLDYLCLADTLFFDIEYAKKIHAINMEEILDHSNPDSKIVISRESLTHKSICHNAGARGLGLVAKRLKSIFGEAKVILTIRNQKDIIKSYYQSGLHTCKTKTGMPIDSFVRQMINMKHNTLLDSLNYETIINYYCSIFGDENVCMLAYEELKESEESFIKKISDFMGIDYNESCSLMCGKKLNRSSDKQAKIHRFICSYFPSLLKLVPIEIKKYIKEKAYLKKELSYEQVTENLIDNMFSESNERLANSCSIDLKQYGY